MGMVRPQYLGVSVFGVVRLDAEFELDVVVGCGRVVVVLRVVEHVVDPVVYFGVDGGDSRCGEGGEGVLRIVLVVGGLCKHGVLGDGRFDVLHFLRGGIDSDVFDHWDLGITGA